jgi:hypothetical protein
MRYGRIGIHDRTLLWQGTPEITLAAGGLRPRLAPRLGWTVSPQWRTRRGRAGAPDGLSHLSSVGLASVGTRASNAALSFDVVSDGAASLESEVSGKAM